MRHGAMCMIGLVGTPRAVWAQTGWEMHPMWSMWGMWGLGMLLVMLVFWGLAIAGLVLAVRWLMQQGRPSRSDAALEILRERYAKGEIDREEYLARKRDL